MRSSRMGRRVGNWLLKKHKVGLTVGAAHLPCDTWGYSKERVAELVLGHAASTVWLLIRSCELQILHLENANCNSLSLLKAPWAQCWGLRKFSEFWVSTKWSWNIYTHTHTYICMYVLNPTVFVSPPLQCKLIVEILLFQIDFASTQFNRQFFLV